MADDRTNSEVARASRRAEADELYDLRCELASAEHAAPPFFTDEQLADKQQRAQLEPLVGEELDKLLAAENDADAANAPETPATLKRRPAGAPTADLARTLAAREAWSTLERHALILVEEGGVDLATAVRWLATPHDELDGHSPASWAEAGRDPEQLRTLARRAAAPPAAEVMKRATLHFDGGGQSPGPVTAACTVELSDGSFDEDVERFDQGTHNIAEWQALILGLRLALKHGERHVVVKGDSLLVVRQINREWKTKNAALRSLQTQAEELLALFESWRVEWIPRKENRRADKLGRGQ